MKGGKVHFFMAGAMSVFLLIHALAGDQTRVAIAGLLILASITIGELQLHRDLNPTPKDDEKIDGIEG